MSVVFETERLVVVPWRDDHAEAAHAAYSQPEFVRYLGNPTPHPDLAHTRAWIAARVKAGFWAAESRDTNALVGAAVLQPLPDGDGEWEVGWHVFPDHQRQGYATEIGRGGIAYGSARRTSTRSTPSSVRRTHRRLRSRANSACSRSVRPTATTT